MTAKHHRHKDASGRWTTYADTPVDLELTKRVADLEDWRATFPNQPDVDPPPVTPPPVTPPPVDPPPGSPPTTGIIVASNASLLSALASEEPSIIVKTGTILKPLTWTNAHGGSKGAPCVIAHETGGPIPIDLGGQSRAFAIKAIGGHDITIKHPFAYNGSVDQMAAYVIGNGGDAGAPGCARLTFEDAETASSITGPGSPGSTANATAHFCYVSKSATRHQDITFLRAVSRGKGLGAMWHLYAEGSGCDRFVADTWEAYGMEQVVMSFAGVFGGVQLINGYAEGCGYIVRAPNGGGTVTARHKGTINRAIHPDTTAAWNIAGVVAA